MSRRPPLFYRPLRALALSLTVIGLLCAGISHSANALTVKAVRLGIHPDKIRAVLELDGKTDFRVFTLANPWRLVVDLPDYDWQGGAIPRPKGSGITSVRQGSLQPGISRIIFELEKPVMIANAFIMPANGAIPDRLVIDFTNTTPAKAKAAKDHVFGKLTSDSAPAPEATAAPADTPAADATPPAATPTPEPTPEQSIGSPPPATPATDNPADTPSADGPDADKHSQLVPAGSGKTKLAHAAPVAAHKSVNVAAAVDSFPVLPARKTPSTPYQSNPGIKPLIIVDAGHGGVDPGTHGAGGVLEKNITLAAAKALKQALEETGHYRVMLTRDTDVYLRLYERVAFARQHKGDLFISLHADSSPFKDNVAGASIYTLSEKASDAETDRLAMHENRADLIAGVDLSHQDDDVANILVDLAMRDTMNQSKFFANMVAGTLQTRDIRTLERTHRSAGFAVLKDPDMPSILVEMGFLSNPREAQALAQSAFQRRLALALTASTDAYFTKMRENNRT